jgi:hypothetical protein
LGMQLKMGGKFHLKLNIGKRPIANKYREGKMKRTLKRELKVREIVKREGLETSIVCRNSALIYKESVCIFLYASQHQFCVLDKRKRKVIICFGFWFYRLFLIQCAGLR